MINFVDIINLTEYSNNTPPAYVEQLAIAQEVENEINQFYIYNDRTYSKEAIVELSNYSSLVWGNSYTSMTSNRVSKVGIKHFPQIGSMGFYNLLDEERSGILCPVFVKKQRYTQPTMAYTQTALTVTFTIAPPDSIEYLCYRIVMRNGYTAFEYITYEETITIDNPYIAGTYECYCVGYANEGQAVSDDSSHISINISEAGVDPRTLHDEHVSSAEFTDGKLVLTTNVGRSIESNDIPDVTVVSASFNTSGYLVLTLSDGSTITSSNVAPSAGNYVTQAELTAAINAAIEDTWEASY